MAQGIGSLTGAAANIANIGLGLAENRRRQRQQDFDLTKAQHDFDRQQAEEQVKDLFTNVNLGETFGYDSPQYQDQLKKVAGKYGITGARLNPETGELEYLGRNKDTGLEEIRFKLDRAKRANIMRLLQAGQRQTLDLGGTSKEFYPMAGIGREYEHTPRPESPLDQQLKRAQIGAFRAQRDKALRDIPEKFPLFQRLVDNFTRYDEQAMAFDPRFKRVMAIVPGIVADQKAGRLKGDTEMVAALLQRLAGSPGQAAASTTPGNYAGSILGQGEAPGEAPPGVPAPQPRIAVPPKRQTPQQRRDAEAASEGERQATIRQEFAQNRETLLNRARAHARRGWTEEDIVNDIARELEQRGNSFLPWGADYLYPRLREGRDRTDLLDEVRKIARGEGASRGGIVRAPYGGRVDEMAGTEVPPGIETRVRRMSLATGEPQSVGAGLVRITAGREM